MEFGVYTLGQYLKGSVRNISVPDKSLLSICSHVELDPDTPFGETTQKERDLSLAWLYVWIAGSPTQSGGYTEEDADWRSTTDSERMSAAVLKNYLDMANAIFEKYGLETISTKRWSMVGHGMRNPRKY